MALIEEFDKSGNWLFRWRSYLPLVLYALAALVMFSGMDKDMDHTSFDWSMTCLGISLFGLLIRAIAVGFAPKATSGRNTKEGQVAEVLNTNGIYSTVRHPLYLGNFFMWLGIILYVGNWWFSLVCCLLFWLYYERIMFAEEHFLRGKFGQVYLNWAEKVPAFIPSLTKWSSADMGFSLKNVLKREYSGFFAIFLSFALIDGMKNYLLYRTWDIEFLFTSHWLYLLGISFVIMITLRSLKHYTSVLNEAGRA